MKMKTIVFLASLFLYTNFIWASPNPAISDLQEDLKIHLNKVFDKESFSIESVKLVSSEKRIHGVGTFFKKKGVHFEASFNSTDQIASFTARMPSNAKLKISNKSLRKLAEKKLEDFLPKAIKKSVHLEQFSFTISKETKKIEELQFVFNALRNWELFQSSAFSLAQIQVEFKVAHPTQKDKRKLTGRLTGLTKIGEIPLNLTGVFQDKKEQFELIGTTHNLSLKESLHSIIGKSNLKGIEIPNSFITLNLDEANLQLFPYQKKLNLAGKSNLGLVDLFVQKNETNKKKKNKLSYVITITTPEDFKLSKLNAKLSALDAVNLANQKIVISSEQKTKKERSEIPSLSQVSTALKKGCSYIAELDMRKLKLDHLLGVKKMIVNTALSEKFRDVVLEGNLETDLNIGPNTKLSGVVFRLQPSPKDFAISLLGVMEAKIDKDLLQFKGGVELVLTDQTLNFLAMMNGTWNNPLGAKGLVVNDLGLQMGASFTTAPAILPNIALTGGVKIGKFKGNAALAFDTRNPSKSMMAISFNKLILMDLFDVVIDPKIQKGIPKEMMKTLRTISLQDVAMEVAPQAVQVLDKNYDAGFRAAGAIHMAGIKGEAAIDIDYKNGMMIDGSVDPIDLKVFKLKGANGEKRPQLSLDLRKGKTPNVLVNGLVNVLGLEAQTDVELLANGFRFMIGGKIFNLFEGKIDAKGKDIAKAGDMFLKVNMQNDLLNFIDKGVTSYIQNNTKKAIKDLTKAQNKIDAAERVVNNWDKEINKMRKVVEKDQAEDRAKVDAAKVKVTAAQTKVDNLSEEIKKIKRSIKKEKNVWKKAKLKTKLTKVQAAKGIASTALKAAQVILNGFRGLNTNPDLDIRVSSLIAKKLSAIAGLKSAKGSLEALKFTLGVSGKAGTFIVDKGTDMLVNIRKANFEGKLKGLDGGMVKLDTELEWMGKKQQIKFDFNFHNPAKAVETLAKKLLKIK